MMALLQRVLNIFFVFVICGIILGSYIYQFYYHAQPCPLCLLQRLAMIGIGVALLMNLRFGIRIEHYGLLLLSATLGRFVSLTQISLHICPEFPTFGEPIFGYDLYVWALFTFTCSVLATAILLILYGFAKMQDYKPTWALAEKIAFFLVCLLTFANVITTLRECGLTSCH